MGGRCKQLASKPASDALLLRAIVVAEDLFHLLVFKIDVPEVGDNEEAEGEGGRIFCIKFSCVDQKNGSNAFRHFAPLYQLVTGDFAF